MKYLPLALSFIIPIFVIKFLSGINFFILASLFAAGVISLTISAADSIQYAKIAGLSIIIFSAALAVTFPILLPDSRADVFAPSLMIFVASAISSAVIYFLGFIVRKALGKFQRA